MDRWKHGGYAGGKETPEHYVWRAMVQRCYSPKAHDKKNYHDVTVCSRWLSSYENFLADMGPRPSAEHQLDRINTFKGYYPVNCRWTTRSVQQKNKRTTKRWTCNGFTGTLVECADRIGISKELAFDRMKRWGTFRKGEQWLPQRVV